MDPALGENDRLGTLGYFAFETLTRAASTDTPSPTSTPLPTATNPPPTVTSSLTITTTLTPLPPTATKIPPSPIPLPTSTPEPAPLRFTGTGDRVLDPMTFPDGLYRVTFRGNGFIGTATLDRVSGDCGFYFGYIYTDEPISEDSLRLRGCTASLSISTTDAWEIVFEKLA